MGRAAALLAALIVSGAFAGDDAARVDLRTPERWSVGEVVSAEISETSRTRAVGPTPDAAAGGQESRLDARLAAVCLAADADGRLARALVRFDAWSVRGAGREDRSLEGALVETTPAGWTLVAAACNPSRAARDWLAERLGDGCPSLCRGLAELGAPGPVGVGVSWEASPPASARRLADEGSPAPADRRPWKFTLTQLAEDATARVAFDETLSVGDARVRGVVRVHGAQTAVPGLAHRTGSAEAVSESDVETTAPGARTRVGVRTERSEKWTAGGVAPAASSPAAGAAPPRAVGAAEAWSAGDACLETGSERIDVVSTPLDVRGREGEAERAAWTVSWTAEIECAEADAAGRPRVFAVKLRDWRSEGGGATDTGLAGAVLRIVRDEPASPPAGASAAAKAWIRARFGRGLRPDDALRAAATPAMPVVEKQTWRVDPDDAASALRARFDVPVDPGSVRATATCARLDAADAAVEWSVDARVAPPPGCATLSAETASGTVHAAGAASGPTSRWSRFGSLRDETRVTALVPGAGPDEFRRIAATQTREIARTPSGPRAWSDRGVARLDAGDFAGAAADFTKSIEIDATRAAVYDHRGIAEFRAGDGAAAVADFTKAIEIDPRDAVARSNRAAARDDLGDAAGALADWTAAADIDPRRARPHLDLARARFAPGRPAAPVVEGLRRAVALSPASDYARLWLWLARAEGGAAAEATKELTDYVAARTPSAADDWFPTLAGVLVGTVGDDAALAAARASAPGARGGRVCEAAFYAGMSHAVRRDAAKAVALFDVALATGERAFTEFAQARRWRAALLLGATTRRADAVVLVDPSPEGPAAAAGLADGDAVVAVDGAPSAERTLDDALRAARVGSTLRLDVLRAGGSFRADIALGVWKAR